MGVKLFYQDNLLKVEINIKEDKRIVDANKIMLNPHPKYTRKFIEEILGENLSDIEKKQRLLGRLRPKEKMDEIKRLIKTFFIENKVFPILISGIKYYVESNPVKIIWE